MKNQTPSESDSEILSVFFTPKELHLIKGAADTANLPLEDFLLQCALDDAGKKTAR